MSKTLLTGSFVALITPFNKDGSVDFAAFRTLRSLCLNPRPITLPLTLPTPSHR